MSRRTLAAVSLAVLTLAACGRGGPPAPIENRGIGVGETTPGMASTLERSPSAMAGSSYTPPPGYGVPSASVSTGSSVQVQPLGEPNDAYAQAATQPTHSGAVATPPSGVVMNPPPANIPTNNGMVTASQPGQPQVLGTMPSTTPVSRGVGVSESAGSASTAVSPPTESAPTAQIDQGDGAFGWPLRGRVLSGYGPKADGQSNEGINIAAPQGSPVYAAKDGTVAYAGNELRSFGNMVLVRHSGGMFTVYAHLDRIAVAKESPITKGQVVGTVGQSGGVAEPQLHFEVRRGSNPQDPMKYLGK